MWVRGEILDAEKMKKCVWVRPKLVSVIEFLGWTEADRAATLQVRRTAR
jgi:hypothetical protein